MKSAALPEPRVLTLRGISKRFGANAAVRSASAGLAAGGRSCLLGHNGAGKTTLLRMIVGLAYPDEGSILVMGEDPAGNPASRRGVGYLPDRPHLYDKLTAREHLTLHAALYGLPVGEVLERGLGLLEVLGASSVADHRAEELSLGTRKKLACTLALAHAPRLLVLDEPLDGLDAAAVRAMEALLLRHCAGRGSVLLSTHSLPFAARFADHYWIMRRGRLTVHEAGRKPGDRAAEDPTVTDRGTPTPGANESGYEK